MERTVVNKRKKERMTRAYQENWWRETKAMVNRGWATFWRKRGGKHSLDFQDELLKIVEEEKHEHREQ